MKITTLENSTITLLYRIKDGHLDNLSNSISLVKLQPRSGCLLYTELATLVHSVPCRISIQETQAGRVRSEAESQKDKMKERSFGKLHWFKRKCPPRRVALLGAVALL